MNTTAPNIETKVQPRTTSRGRRILRRIGRGLKWLGIGIVTILIVALVLQAVSVEFDKRGYLPPGQMVNVDGHMLHIYCTGTESPTVMLWAGHPEMSAEDHVLLKAIHDSVPAFSSNTVVRVIEGAKDACAQYN